MFSEKDSKIFFLTNFVCQLFGAGQEAYSRFIRAFLLTASYCGWQQVDKSSETEPVKLQTMKTKQFAER